MNVVLGDIHFRDDKDYFIESSNQFLKWFKNYKYNNKDNDLILAGDLVESHLLSGTVADFLERFISYSRFNSIHICVGNHDKKKYHDEDQLAYEFYHNKPNVYIYENPTEALIGGQKVLILPYYTGVNKHGLPMNEYYAHIHENSDFSNNYDLVVGHFAGPEFSFYGASDSVKNLDRINTKKIILGHIHTREMNKEIYIGSTFAGKKSENDYSRSALIFDGNKWIEDKLPLFNEFLTVTYPEQLPLSKAIVPIYTILNCASESVAKSKYGNIFIRRTTTDDSDNTINRNEDLDRQFTSIKEMDSKVLFDAFVESQEVPLDKEVISDCKKLLKIS